MIRSELDAAGVKDPALRDAYQRCRMLNAEHGRTFFLATRLLAPEQRPAVHALYGFARRADDILDDFDPTAGPPNAPNGCSGWPRSCSISLSSRRTAATIRRCGRWCTPRAGTASPGRCSTTS